MLRTPPKYLINEAKFNTTTRTRTTNHWKNTLSSTRYGKQMDDKWVEKRLRDMFDKKMARDIYKNSSRTLTGVSNKGNKIEIFELTNNTASIKKLDL